MPAPPDPVYPPQKNTIIEWQAPPVQITKKYKHLGVVSADPDEYRKLYSTSLLKTNEIPDFVTQIEAPDGIKLASNMSRSMSYELEGDLHALKLIDLDKEGLTCYKKYLQPSLHIYKAPEENSKSFTNRVVPQLSPSSSISSESIKVEFLGLLREVFNEIDKTKRGYIELNDAMEAILQINARLKRSYNENDMKEFFKQLDPNSRGILTFDDFKKVFESIFF